MFFFMFERALIKRIYDAAIFANLTNKPFCLAELAVLTDVVLPTVVRLLQLWQQLALLDVVQVV